MTPKTIGVAIRESLVTSIGILNSGSLARKASSVKDIETAVQKEMKLMNMR